MRAERQTVDLTAYPDLVVICLGLRVRGPRGLLTLFGLGPQIQKSCKVHLQRGQRLPGTSAS